jgi:3-hydroxyacyl-[acyl-carrier-protein] dehydratase
MAAEPFVDLTKIDLDHVHADRDAIYDRLPHRFEFTQLDALVHFDRDKQVAVARRIVREDEFWVRGHIPGRPIMPGVLMIESAAHAASYLALEVGDYAGFLGFAGVDQVKFRGAVMPPATMHILLKLVEARSRRFIADAQGIVEGKLVFEGRIAGMPV